MYSKTGFYFIILIIAVDTHAQQRPDTRSISGLTDVWGIPVTYVGTVQNGQPEGTGMYLYPDGKAERFVGSFKAGLPDGKGILQFRDSAFIWGEWQQGKTQGKGAYLSEAQHLYIGHFSLGKKDGEGILIFPEGAIFQGSFIEDKYHNRGIFISSSGLYFNDNEYRKGKKDGSGFTYDLNRKKLFTGKWKNGKWAGTTQPGYESIVLKKDFFISKNDEQIMMAQLDNNRQLDGTGFIYKPKSGFRYFGQFEKGAFEKGVLINDTSISYGNFKQSVLQGFGSYYIKGKYYEEGYFENGHLSGSENLSVNMIENAVYFGEANSTQGITGKGWFANAKNSLMVGDFKEDSFTGTGYKIDSSGYCTGGNWKSGLLEKINFINAPDGSPVNPEPETLEQAISDLIKMHPFAYDPISGVPAVFNNSIGFEKIQLAPYKIDPESFGSFLGTYKNHKLFIASLHSSPDQKESSEYYERICIKLSTIRFTGPGGSPMQLRTADPLRPANSRKALTIFSVVPGVPYPYDNFAVMVVSLFNQDAGSYDIVLLTGDRQVVEVWRTSF